MRRVVAIVVGLSTLGVALIALGLAGPLTSQVETPAYTIERSDGAIELRAYPALTVAAVTVDGTRGAAVNRGFRTLANYIFGANADATKIEMTAPVMQSRDDDAGTTGDGTWVIRFVMPRTWASSRLPKPRDSGVTIETMPASQVAVIRFSGFWRDALLARKTEELHAWIVRQGLAERGAPIYAFYNPPWTLPIFRRNEVMIVVAPAAPKP